MATTHPRSARRYYALSRRIAERGVREARKAAPTGPATVASVVVAHQMAQAKLAEQATGQMLAEQGIDAAADALLNTAGFTSEVSRLLEAIETASADDFRFDRMVSSILQDTARAAQEVATAAIPDIGWVRHLVLPSCSRCAVLAGRVYRYSEGFRRHPGCDCVMVPTTVGNTALAYDLGDLARTGQVTGLSKADRKALAEGADFAQIVNVRSRKAGLTEAGRVLERAGRPTPEGIFRMASDRDEALALLKRHGYIR